MWITKSRNTWLVINKKHDTCIAQFIVKRDAMDWYLHDTEKIVRGIVTFKWHKERKK